MSRVRTVDGLPDDGPVAQALYLADSREINVESEELCRVETCPSYIEVLKSMRTACTYVSALTQFCASSSLER